MEQLFGTTKGGPARKCPQYLATRTVQLGSTRRCLTRSDENGPRVSRQVDEVSIRVGAVRRLLLGVASLLVAVPVMRSAWYSLRYPSLHGITDQLIALAMLGAWATGDLLTAALLPIIMIFGQGNQLISDAMQTGVTQAVPGRTHHR